MIRFPTLITIDGLFQAFLICVSWWFMKYSHGVAQNFATHMSSLLWYVKKNKSCDPGRHVVRSGKFGSLSTLVWDWFKRFGRLLSISRDARRLFQSASTISDNISFNFCYVFSYSYFFLLIIVFFVFFFFLIVFLFFFLLIFFILFLFFFFCFFFLCFFMSWL